MDTSDVVAGYGAAWNETDQVQRTTRLERSWADDGVYHDPTGTAEGRAALVGHIRDFQAMYPGHTIDLTSGVDSNGAELRWTWMVHNDVEVIVEGVDSAELAPDGRVRRIGGFFEPFPPLDDQRDHGDTARVSLSRRTRSASLPGLRRMPERQNVRPRIPVGGTQRTF
jgi:hypothetical protein